jgi:hypothetical protein
MSLYREGSKDSHSSFENSMVTSLNDNTPEIKITVQHSSRFSAINAEKHKNDA